MTNDRLKPLLVVVSGAPATGKTTLASRLAPELGIARFTKDDFKESLGDWLPPASIVESRQLGAAAYAILYRVTAQVLESGAGVLLESNFNRGFDESQIRPLLPLSRPVLIHLWSPFQLVNERYRLRSDSGVRHPAHFDGERISSTHSQTFDSVWERFDQPMDLNVPTLTIDTTDDYVEDLGPLLQFIRTAVGSTTP